MIHVRIQSIKFFHLLKDQTSHVPEKVFLIEEKIKGIKSIFRFDSKIIGLMGTKESITSYLL